MKAPLVLVLCTNTVKGTKSLGAIPLLKINDKKTILQYLYNNIRTCWPDSKIVCSVKNQDQRLIKYIDNNFADIECDLCDVDHLFNESQALKQVFEKQPVSDTIVLDVNCVLDKNMFKKFKDYDLSMPFMVENTYTEYKSKLGCILNKQSGSTQNIFFGLPNRLLKYYYIPQQYAHHIVESKPANSKFLFELLNSASKNININSIKTKKCININCIKDYKKMKEINFV